MRHSASMSKKRTLFKEKVWIYIEILVKFMPKDPISNMLALVQVMIWCGWQVNTWNNVDQDICIIM